MKVINGKRYYTINESAELINRTKLTIHKWDALSRKGEEVGMDRLIPKPTWTDGGSRLWTDEDLDKMRNFTTHMEYGQLSDYKEEYHKRKTKQIMEELKENREYQFKYKDNKSREVILEVKITDNKKVFFNKYVKGQKEQEVEFSSVKGAIKFLFRKNVLHI